MLAGCGAGGPGPAIAPVPPADGVPLGALPQQQLARGQCGLFLWKTGEGARLVLAANSGPPPFARILLDGHPRDLARLTGADGPAGEATARYGDGTVTVALALTLEPREGLSDGAVAAGAIRVERTGGEAFAVPVSGLLACG